MQALASLEDIENKFHHANHMHKYMEKEYKKEHHLRKHFETQFAPGHFYSPYPDLKEMKRREKQIFDRSKRAIPGIDLRETEQLTLLEKLARHYKKLPYQHKKKSAGYSYKLDHHAYAHTDAIVLFCMLLELQPKKIVEIGSGYSSALMTDVKKHFLQKLEITCVEPYPQLLHDLTKDAPKESFTLIDKPLWETPDKVFTSLNDGDILFIDSTHVSKAGSDVNQIFFEILPKLKPGVIIHIHDIFYPFEYPYEWIKETRAWTEDYIVRAFLHNNDAYDILLFNNFLNIHHSKELEKYMPLASKNSGGSLWLRKTK
jgi:predicted O-methyltransferase YrrM